MKDRLIAKDELTEVGRIEDLLNEVCFGNSAILVDGHNIALIADVKGWKQRSINEPSTEPTLHGSKEGFVETLRTNTSLIRRRVCDPRLRIEQRTVGAIGRTGIAIVYIAGVARDDVVQELRSRINRISIDSIQSAGQLEEYIEDAPFSPFPTLLRTERVDRVTGSLLEGRVAILVDGTPFVALLPATFSMFLTAPDDYFERFLIGNFLRFLRLALFFIALTFPAFFVAALTFHQELFPTPLVLSIASQREGVPFPALLEALMLEIAWETLREASIRVPIVFGPAVSILGVLFLGQVAVQAGLVSPFMVIVISLTAIASLGTPIFSLSVAARLLRFGLLVLGGTMGLYGVVWGLAALGIHLAVLAVLRSFGVPYFEPLMPLVLSSFQDSLLRFPWWAMRQRPESVVGSNISRQPEDQRPKPPDQNNT